jgi:phage gp29-like protein
MQLMGVAIEALLREIQDVVNNDLIRHTFELNDWDIARMPTVHYGDFEADDLEAFSKAIQRMSSVGMIERDREVLNKVRESLGVTPFPEDEPVKDELLTGNSSKAGQGMATPFEGTRTSDGGQNDNDNNLSNVA